MASVLLWSAFGFFVLMIIYRFVRYHSMPLHLRWELYPMPLEPNHHYGGSYMEEVDYVHKERKHLKLGGVKELASEVFFLKKVRLHNRYGLWPFSLAMHWGIYLTFVWIGLMVLERFWAPAFLPTVTNAVAILSWVLGAAGCLGLVLKRATTPDLAAYTAPIDYFNLAFLWAIFVTGLVGWLSGPAFLEGLRGYVAGNLAFGSSAVASLVWVHFGLFELFLVYMPFSRLFHYVAKYFTFDKVLWDDRLNTSGSDIEKQIQTQLSYKVSWSAPHIAPGKTWSDQVAMTDAREAGKS